MSESKRPVPSLEEVMGQQNRTTGNEIPDGNYPATLYGFSDPFWMKPSEKFKKGDQPQEDRLMIHAKFAIMLKNGNVEGVELLVGVPQGEIHRKSNAYKLLKALANGDPELINKDGDFSAKGSMLKTYIGRTAMVATKTNDKGFSAVDTVAPPFDGAKFPSAEDIKKLEAAGSSKDVPF